MRFTLTCWGLLVVLASSAFPAVGAELAKEIPPVPPRQPAMGDPGVLSPRTDEDALAFIDVYARWQMTVSVAEAELAKAEANVEIAKLALREYVDGTYLLRKQTIESEIFVAKEQTRRAMSDLSRVKTTTDREEVRDQTQEEAEFDVHQKRMEEKIAETKLYILEELTKPRTVAQLQRDLQFAERHLQVLRLRCNLAREGLERAEAERGRKK